MSRPIRVLRVLGSESGSSGSDALEAALEQFDVRRVRSAETALETLSDRTVDCVLADYRLEDGNGVELLSSIREKRPSLPFLLFVKDGSEAVAAQAIGEGVTDYIRANTVSGESALATRIERAVEDNRTERDLVAERKVFVQGPAVIFRWGTESDWPIEYVSENVEDVFEYTPAELESGDTTYADLVHEADLPALRKEARKYTEGDLDRLGHDPYRLETSEGDYRWVLEHTRAITDPVTGEKQLFGYVIDITKRRKQELELQQFREAVEQTGHAVYITDPDGTIEYVNPAFERVTGYDEGEALGRTPNLLKSGRHEEGFYDDIWDAISSGETVETEIVDVRADGEEVVLHQTVSPIVDDGGNLYKFVAVAQDITNRKEHEKSLERAHEELRTVIDLVPDLLFAKNREGRYVLANRATAEAYGSTPEAIEGSLETEVIPVPAESTQFQANDLEVIESGEPIFNREEELTTAEDETRIYQTTKIPYVVPGTGEQAVLGYARDVTELKAYERELETQRDNLEILNQVVRHDIRNTLQLVLAYIQSALSTDEQQSESPLENARVAAREAVEITETARDVTEVMLQTDVELAPTSLRSVLEQHLEEIRSSYRDVVLDVEGSIPDVDVYADDMLGSVFRNLLSNAIQHNQRGTPEITVSASLEGENAILRFADNGPGIPETQREQIFEKGQTGLDSEGTGLGLYLVRTLVDRYDGTVSLEDNEPEGTVFVVRLPVAE